MKKKELFIILSTVLIAVCIYFYKVILFQQIPFPGDLLSGTPPYKMQSYLGYAPGGYPNKAQDRDVMYEIYPWKYFAISQMKKGIVPFWNPHNFSGNLLMQNFQTAIFYPFNVFFFFLPFNTAWTILILSQPILAIVFMYIFLREYKLHPIACVAGAISFAFSSYMVVWLEYSNIASTILWLPLLLLLVKRFIDTKKFYYFIFGVLAGTVAILAGYIQGLFYMYIVTTLYSIYYVIQSKKKQNSIIWIALVAYFFLPVLLSAYQLLPTIKFFLESTRSNYTTEQMQQLLQPLYYWVTIFSADFFGNPASRNYFLPITYIERVMYVGVPIVLFALYGSISKQKQKMFFMIFGLAVLFIATNIPGIAYIYKIPIPVISTTVPTRILSIFIFCTTVLSAFGIDYWIKMKEKKHIIPLLFITIYGLLWIGVFILSKFVPSLFQYRGVIVHNLLFSTILAIGSVILFYIKDKLPKVVPYLLLMLILLDTYYFFSKITPFSPQELIYPTTPVVAYLRNHAGINRFWGYGDAYIAPNFQSVDGTYSPEGNDPLHLRTYGILLASTTDGKYPTLLPRPDANLAPGYGSSDLKNNKARQKILNLLGVKYLLYISQTGSIPDYSVIPDKIYKLVWNQGSWQIYENKDVLPRFFMTSHYIIKNNVKDALQAIYTSDLASTLILNKKPPLPDNSNGVGKAQLLTYNATNVQIKTQTNQPMILFLSDNYYPSWNALVDGNQTAIYRADVTLRAVVVPKGTHTVTFTYSATYFSLGITLAVIGVFLGVLISFLLYKSVSKKIV